MKIVIHLAVALALLILGWIFYNTFFHFSLEQLKPHQIDFQSTNFTSQFEGRFYFAALLGALPLIHLLIQFMVELKDTKQHVLLYTSMIVSGIVFWQIRIHAILEEFEKFEMHNIGGFIKSSMNIDQLHFGPYMTFGIFLAALSFFALLKLFPSKPKDVDF